MKYLILFGLLGIIYLIYRGISKYLDYAAKVLLTVLPVSAIVYLLTINIPYNELLILPVVGYMMASILDKEDDTNGAEVLGLDYKTSKLTLKLASGNIEEYTLTHYPVRITNPESVDEKLSSALYAYLWTSHISSPATILDWDENTKQMTYKLENNSSYQVVKMGVETFYKPEVQQARNSSRGAMDTLRDIAIGYTFYKATTGGFK